MVATIAEEAHVVKATQASQLQSAVARMRSPRRRGALL